MTATRTEGPALTAALAALDQEQAALQALLGEAEDAEVAEQAQLDLLRSGVASVTADQVAHAEAEVKRAALLCLNAHERVQAAHERVQEARLTDALDRARAYAAGDKLANLRAQRDKANAEARLLAELTAGYRAEIIALGAEIRDAAGLHVQPGDGQDGWIGRTVPRPGQSLGFQVDGTALTDWEIPQ